MRHTRIILGILIICLMFTLAACKGAPERKDLEGNLKSLAVFYNENVKWQRYERAIKYIPEEERSAFLLAQEQDRELLNITEIKIMDVYLDEEDMEQGTVLVMYTYYKWPDNRLKKDLLEQSWNYDSEKSWWYIDYKSTKHASVAKQDPPSN